MYRFRITVESKMTGQRTRFHAYANSAEAAMAEMVNPLFRIVRIERFGI